MPSLPLYTLVFARAHPSTRVRACQPQPGNPNRATLLAVDCCLLVQSNGERPCPMFPGKGVALFWCVIYEFIWSRGRACGPGAKPCSVVREARPAYVVKNCSAEPCLRLYVPASRVCTVAIH